MSILVERMLMHWLTRITSSLCSRLVSYCVKLSSTQHPSSSPSDMVSKLTRSHSLTSYAYESALTQPPPSQPWLHLTLGRFHKTATSFATRDCSMSPMIRTFNWTSLSRSVPRAKSHSHPHLVSSGFTPSSPPRAPQPTLISPDNTRPGPRGLSQLHLKSQPKPWSECTASALGIWMPLEITW